LCRYSVVVCGHSLGGMMATAAAYNIATKVEAVSKKKVVLSVFTYGQGVVGNSTFADAYNAAVPVHWRHVNDRDLIPRVGFITPVPGWAVPVEVSS
jgi:predicted lipase